MSALLFVTVATPFSYALHRSWGSRSERFKRLQRRWAVAVLGAMAVAGAVAVTVGVIMLATGTVFGRTT
jgi:putative flippase GtrA